MTTLQLSHFGTHAIVYRREDETEWRFYHPTDDDFGQFWFTSSDDAYRILSELGEAELEELELWDETVADYDDGPYVKTHYKVMALVDCGDEVAMPHHRATVDSTFCCACGETWPCNG